MAHPKIAEAAVIGVAHERWGEAPLACVVKATDGQDLTEEEVLTFLEGKIAKGNLARLRAIALDAESKEMAELEAQTA